MVYIIHNKVAGRARFKIIGLYGSSLLKKYLESALSSRKEICKVSASTTTSNILVFFNLELTAFYIAGLIEDVLNNAPLEYETGQGTTSEVCQHHRTPPPARNSLSGKVSLGRYNIKEKIESLLPFHTKQDVHPWHIMSPDEILALYESSREKGLSQKTAKDRLRQYGPNILPESRPRSRIMIFFDQFKSLPVYLLGAAALFSVFTGGIADAIVISGVIAANAIIGYITETESEKTINSLKKSFAPMAGVFREGSLLTIPSEEVVVGDILLLKPGSYVVADSRVLEAKGLSIDQSSLTGESMPVRKRAGSIKNENTPLTDRENMLFMGTSVTGGQGIAVVIATGEWTEMGKLQVMLEKASAPETPIEKRLRIIGKQMVIMAGAVCVLVFIIGYLRGYGLLEMIRMSISLAAAAVPEGLPAAATTTFALGIRNMKKQNVLIRKLQAIETLGAVQTVCFDKTGTLTRNKMSVLRIYTASIEAEIRNGQFFSKDQRIDPLCFDELKKILYTATLCNEARVASKQAGKEYVLTGSPTENALLHLSLQAGIDVLDLYKTHTLLDMNLRTERHHFMSTLYSLNGDGARRYCVKGSPPEVLKMCKFRLRGNQIEPLTPEIRQEIEGQNERMAADALRVLGAAYKEPKLGEDADSLKGLTWLGLVGMADPIREGIKDLIDTFQRAGIETIMITGDQGLTASAIAKQLSFNGEGSPEVLDATELESLSSSNLSHMSKKVQVYSRVSPALKLKIVKALQESGKVVAMTGDGINDSPALKAADIGIAMGRSGTDIARDVADVVLENDNLETLIIAVKDGRTTYNNLKKSVHFLLSTNFSEVMLIFVAMSAGIGFPLNAMQLLWINIISDIFPGLALSLESAEPDVLEQKPRDPKAPLFTKRDYKRMTFESAVITGSALSSYGYGIFRYGMGAQASTLAFHTLTIGQLLHALSCRSERHSIFNNGLPRNHYLSLAIWGSLALQCVTMFVPGFGRFLGLTTPSLEDLLIIIGNSFLSFLINESTKYREAIRKKGQTNAYAILPAFSGIESTAGKKLTVVDDYPLVPALIIDEG